MSKKIVEIKRKGILNETPIIHSDDDSFKLEKYVNAFNEIITKTQTPFTISIQGEWGSGKTSFVNLVKNSFGDDVKFVEFSTWEYSQISGSSITNMLLKDLMRVILEGDGSLQEAINMIDSKRNITGKVLKEILGGVLSTKGIDIEKVGNIVLKDENEYNYDTPGKELETLKKSIEEKIEESGLRYVIFIDDLDRISPNEVLDILEALQIFLNIKGCVFILAVDNDIITRGFELKMGGNINKIKSQNFYDKIIQLSFTYPRLDSGVAGNYVVDLLHEIPKLRLTENEKEVVKGIFNDSVGSNPRKIKRIINLYWLTLEILSRKTKEDIISTIYFTCMQYEYSYLYDFIRRYGTKHDKDKKLKELIELVNAGEIEKIMSESNDNNNIEFVYENPVIVNDFKNVMETLVSHSEDSETMTVKKIENYLSYFEEFLFSINDETPFNNKFYTALNFNNTLSSDEQINDDIHRVVVHLKEDKEIVGKIKDALMKHPDVMQKVSTIRAANNNRNEVVYQVYIDFKDKESKTIRGEIKWILNNNEIETKRVTTHKYSYDL